MSENSIRVKLFANVARMACAASMAVHKGSWSVMNKMVVRNAATTRITYVTHKLKYNTCSPARNYTWPASTVVL